MVRRWWQRPWTAVLVGEESGIEIPVHFVRFRREAKAQQWVDRMNGDNPSGLTRWEVRNLK